MKNNRNENGYKNRNCCLYGVCSGSSCENNNAEALSKFGLKILSLNQDKPK